MLVQHVQCDWMLSLLHARGDSFYISHRLLQLLASLFQLELLTSSDAETTLIAGSLVDIGCCPRCVLRYLGEKRPWVYKSNQEVRLYIAQ